MPDGLKKSPPLKKNRNFYLLWEPDLFGSFGKDKILESVLQEKNSSILLLRDGGNTVEETENFQLIRRPQLLN